MPNGLLNGLKAYWKADEAANQTRADSVNSYDLSNNGTVDSTATAKIIKAASFVAAQSDYLSYATAALDDFDIENGSPDFTFTGWVRPGITTPCSIFNKEGAAAVDRSPQIGIGNSGGSKFVVAVRNAADSAYHVLYATTFGAPSTNTWYFIAAWVDSAADSLNIQINNGTVDSLDMASGGVSSTPNAPINLGRVNSGNFYSGQMDEMGWWRSVLTPDQRTALYNNGNALAFSEFDTGAGAFIPFNYLYYKKRKARYGSFR